jgi:hypothetical protein
MQDNVFGCMRLWQGLLTTKVQVACLDQLLKLIRVNIKMNGKPQFFVITKMPKGIRPLTSSSPISSFVASSTEETHL